MTQNTSDIAAPASAAGDTISLSDAERLFGINYQTLRRWEREGLVPQSTRTATNRLYPLEQLIRVLESSGRLAPANPYPDPERSGCYRLPLCGSNIRRREAIIDAESLPLVEGKRWNWSIGGGDRVAGFVSLAHSTEITPLRRIIVGVTDPEIRVGHLNGDGLDCRRENLFVRTMSQQVYGSRKMGTVNGREYTSRFKGVCWEMWSGKWVAQIRANGKGRKLGRFGDEIAAAEAYDEAARKFFGEHARLNFPEEPPMRAAA